MLRWTRVSRAHRWVLLSLGVLVPFGMSVTSTVGCGAKGNGAGGNACITKQNCYDYSCYKPGTMRSFRTDVLPIFEQSCSLSTSCHGNKQSPMSSSGYQPYLGETDPQTTPSDVKTIRMLIVDQASPTATNEKIVDPGKPETSFLMQKMDGTVKCSTLQCVSKGCGTGMPQGVDPLPVATRDKVRDWIKQGALDN